eukprot:gene752-biopygen16681
MAPAGLRRNAGVRHLVFKCNGKRCRRRQKKMEITGRRRPLGGVGQDTGAGVARAIGCHLAWVGRGAGVARACPVPPGVAAPAGAAPPPPPPPWWSS